MQDGQSSVDSRASKEIMMKVLAINGSHRKGKNTATMLKLVLHELEQGGVQTGLLEIADLTIECCRACNHCLKKTECKIEDDDMAMVAQKMIESDAILLGSPVYFGNVTESSRSSWIAPAGCIWQRTFWTESSEPRSPTRD